MSTLRTIHDNFSTRCIIQVQDLNSVAIYKDHNGHPLARLPWLHAFNKRFNEERGDDPGSKFAQLVRDSEFRGVVGCPDGGLPDLGQEYEYILRGDSIRVGELTAPDSLSADEVLELIKIKKLVGLLK